MAAPNPKPWRKPPMAAPTNPNAAPLTFAAQELKLAQVVLTGRGWTITDARETDGELIIIASRKKPQEPQTAQSLKDLA